MARDAKTRKDTRKRAHAELSARKTDASRKRRLYNKTLRDAIHTIDPDVKVKIIDQHTYIDGDRVEVVDGKIVPSALPEGAIKTECDYEDAVAEYQEVMDSYAIGETTAVKPEEPDCKLPAEKKSWKQVLREWSNG